MNWKKYIAVWTAVFMTIAVLPVLSVRAAIEANRVELDGKLPQVFEPGDVDMDGVLTGHDAAMVSRYLREDSYTLTELEMQLADVNEDGVVNQADADWIFENQVYPLGDLDLNGYVNLDDGFEVICVGPNVDETFRKRNTRLRQNLADVDANGCISIVDGYEIVYLYCLRAGGVKFQNFEKGIYYFEETSREDALSSMGGYFIGDVDLDGMITGHDTALVSRYLNGESAAFYGLRFADYNANGVIDWEDLDWIRAHEEYQLGDVDMDGKLTMDDVSYILQDYAYAAAGKSTYGSKVQVHLADTDADGADAPSMEDAIGCLQMYARSAAGLPVFPDDTYDYIS